MPANLQSQLSLSFLVTGIFQSTFVKLDFVQNPMKHVMIAMVVSKQLYGVGFVTSNWLRFYC